MINIRFDPDIPRLLSKEAVQQLLGATISDDEGMIGAVTAIHTFEDRDGSITYELTMEYAK